MMEIEYICDAKEHIPTAVRWIYDEFIDGIRPGVTIDMISKLYQTSGKDKLPVTLVAIEDSFCAGVISLVANDLKIREYTPWLSSLYVHPAYRKKGIGEALVGAIKETARKLGYNELYLRTEHAQGYYKKLGWQEIETLTDEFGLITTVFKFCSFRERDKERSLKAGRNEY